jgi:DNA-binding phage protein
MLKLRVDPSSDLRPLQPDEAEMGGKVDIVDREGLPQLLRVEIKRAGSIAAWARKFGIDRTVVYRALRGKKPAAGSIIEALGLEVVYRRRT